MGNFILRVLINAVGIAITASILPGITVANNDLGTLLIIGLVFGIVNALVKPILVLLTCPFVIATLGLFLLVINGLMLLLTEALRVAIGHDVHGLDTTIYGLMLVVFIIFMPNGILGTAQEIWRRRGGIRAAERRPA